MTGRACRLPDRRGGSLPVSIGMRTLCTRLSCLGPCVARLLFSAWPQAGSADPVIIHVTETIAVSDQAGPVPAPRVPVAETISVSGAYTVAPAPQLPVLEVMTVSDTYTVMPSVVINVEEAIGLSDSVTSPSIAYLLVTNAIGGGAIASSPPGIECGPRCSQAFSSEIAVDLEAQPAPGYTFSGWSGDCSGAATCRIDMNRDRNVTATFIAIDTDDDGVPDIEDLDDDNDGIPDAIEQQYDFLDPLNPDDAALDFDGDGYSNLVEIQQGTRPDNRHDSPAVRRIFPAILHLLFGD